MDTGDSASGAASAYGPRRSIDPVRRLAGGVAHEFNNLLTSIHGYAELVLRTFDVEDPRRADIEQVLRSAQRGAWVTRQLLLFTEERFAKTEAINLSVLLREAEGWIRRQMGGDVAVAFDLDPAIGTIIVDRDQINVILDTLVANARDAMPDGGRFTMTTSNVDVPISRLHSNPDLPPGEYVRWSVVDSGCGMTADVLSHLFQPFFTTKPVGVGVGLALSAVYGIVDRAGGHIFVTSEPGRGSTFVIYLPRASRS